MKMSRIAIAALFLIHFGVSIKFKDCDFGQELIEKHNLTVQEVNYFTCIAISYSLFDTRWQELNAYGLYATSDKWCSTNRELKKPCNVQCKDLLDDNITDDIACASHILEAEGLSAWRLSNEDCTKLLQKMSLSCFTITIEPSPMKFNHCFFAQLLIQIYDLTVEEAKLHTCIMKSQAKPDAVTNGTYYGLYEIGEKWCSINGTVGACQVQCKDLLDDNISDDVACTSHILKVSGLSAWRLSNEDCTKQLHNISPSCFESSKETETPK